MPRTDPLIQWLYRLRSVPDRGAGVVRGTRPAAPASQRLRDLPDEDAEWVRLGERPGEEIVLARSPGRGDGGAVAAPGGANFHDFAEPGWVRIPLLRWI